MDPNKHIIKHSTSLFIKDMHIKTTTIHYRPIKMVLKYCQVLMRIESNPRSTHTLWAWKRAQPLWKTACQFVVYLNINDPAIPRLDIYPRGNETYVHTKTYINVLASLFIIAENWKQLKCASFHMDEPSLVHSFNLMLISDKRQQHG